MVYWPGNEAACAIDPPSTSFSGASATLFIH